jgi:peptidoglycan/xylan/chitin deacetylase (PgdA/CDA1 family)
MAFKDKAIRLGFGAFRATGLHRLASPMTRGRGVVLMLHHVRPWRPANPGFAPNRGLEITPEFLDDALKAARDSGFDFVTMDEALRRIVDGGPSFAALTFDDGYRDLVAFALPILERWRAPFTAYAATGYVGRTARLWWLELEEAVRRLDRVEVATGDFSMRLPCASDEEKNAAFHHLYWALRAGSEERLLRIIGELAALAEIDGVALVEDLCLNWDELAELARHPLATIGAHTVNHRMLAKWPEDVARTEMAASKAEIESRLGVDVRHFAYPVGDPTSAGPRDFALARELGFSSAVTTRPGMIFDDHKGHETALPRLSVNGGWQDVGYLEVLLSGAPFALWNRGRRLNVA